MIRVQFNIGSKITNFLSKLTRNIHSYSFILRAFDHQDREAQFPDTVTIHETVYKNKTAQFFFIRELRCRSTHTESAIGEPTQIDRMDAACFQVTECTLYDL